MNGSKVNLGSLSMDMSIVDDTVGITVFLDDKILHEEIIKGGRVEQVAAVMTLLSAGVMSQDQANAYLTVINKI